MPPSPVPDPDAGAVTTRRLSRQRLLEAIRRLGPISRAELAKRTRWSPATVSALVEDLAAEAGLLQEVGVGLSSGGRPPILLAFNAEFGVVAGVDIGSRLTRFALSDLQGRVVARRDEVTHAASRDATIGQVLGGIERLVVESGRDLSKLFAVGIAAPGMTDVTSGRVIRAPALAGWTDVPLREMVETRFGAPARIDNAANMAALGERWRGVARDTDTFVFVALGAGVGVGAGLVLDGRLHRGHRWHAGGIGRMTLDARAWEAGVGERGDLARRIEEAAAGVEELAAVLGSAVANIVAVLDPRLVVFGGAPGQVGPRLIERVRRVVSSIVPPVPRLEVSALGDEAQVLGAVYSAMEIADARLVAIAGHPGNVSTWLSRPTTSAMS